MRLDNIPHTAPIDLNTKVLVVDLYELIQRSHGREAADAYRAYAPTEDDIALLAHEATKVLAAFGNEPGACVLLSACCAAAFLEGRKAPLHVVAGSLSIEGVPIFSDGKPFDGDAVFSQSNISWDGHAWLVLGDRMLDISLMRTAHSQKSPPALTRYVMDRLGSRRTPMVCQVSEALGMAYVPQYVLRDDQITGLVKGAVERATQIEGQK